MDNQEKHGEKADIKQRKDNGILHKWTGFKIFSAIRFSMPAGNVMETLEKLIKSPEAAFPCIFINWPESSAV